MTDITTVVSTTLIVFDIIGLTEIAFMWYDISHHDKTDDDIQEQWCSENNKNYCSKSGVLFNKDMTKLSKEEFAEELHKLEKVVNETAGVTVKKYYRPPEGRFSEENLRWAQELGYKTVLWSLAYADWDNNRQPDPEKAKKLILDNVHNGAVILLHPTSKTNADILDSLLTSLEGEGYRFGTLDELFSAVGTEALE